MPRFDSLEAGVTPQDVVPRLFDQHTVNGQHVEAHLKQNVLETGQTRTL